MGEETIQPSGEIRDPGHTEGGGETGRDGVQGISAQTQEDPWHGPEEPRGRYRGHPGDHGTRQPHSNE